ncbi:MAG: lytic transglycosylase domain-containing protein [Aminipila sp.]
MEIDGVKLASLYAQNESGRANLVAINNDKAPDFDKTLNNIISGNEVNKRLSKADVVNDETSKIVTTEAMEDIFKRAAEKYDVPEELLKAVAKAESGFNPNAVSKCGAMGVMQLMPNTAKSLGVTNAFDPEQNIMGGASYLSQKLKNYDGDITLALAAYNAGPGNVAKYGGVPPFTETQNYIKKIFGYMGEEINIPEQSLNIKSNLKENLGQLLGDKNSFSEINAEKAFFSAQLQILKHQLDMQNLFASSNSSSKEDEENLDINAMIDSLSRL